MSAKEAALQELMELSRINDGLLNPHDVVEFARSPHTALHSKFDWDDSVAGHNWRLHQARMLINVLVTVLPQVDKEVRAFVSVQSDRNREGGYRTTQSVLADAELRSILLDQYYRDMQAFISRFHLLNEAAKVIRVMEMELARQPQKKKGRPSKSQMANV
jgi:hypothetical protein